MSSNKQSVKKEWYAVYTVVRHEKVVHQSLIDKGVYTFLPLMEVVNRWKDRNKKVSLPLFPGYLFINTDLSDKLSVLKTKGVVRILGFNGDPYPVPYHQIENIQKLVSSNLYYDPYKYYVQGKDVIVVRGPLEGAKGKIIERRGNYRLILAVDLIRSAVSVEVDIDDVELS
jgi:transcription antitermination factor NusG